MVGTVLTLNALTLGPLHVRLKNFIKKLIEDTDIVLGPDASYRTATFDGQEWETEGVFEAIAALRPKMPHLRVLFVEFLKGALETWERFTAEFDPGGDIDGLTPDEQDEFWLPATNDANEGALGGFRKNAVARPNQTVHQYEFKDTLRRNETQDFIDHEFIDADHAFVRAEARRVQDSRPQKQLQDAQVAYDKAEVEEHRLAEEKSNKKAEQWHEVLDSVVLITDPQVFDRQPKLTVPKLTNQLNVWRYRLGAPGIPAESKISKRAEKVAELGRLLTAYPGGVVPEAERVAPKRKAPAIAEGPYSALHSLPQRGARVLAPSVQAAPEDTVGETDLLYESDAEDI